MDEETGAQEPGRSQGLDRLHPASYDVFILVLTIYMKSLPSRATPRPGHYC
jgi:hypothetical protein